MSRSKIRKDKCCQNCGRFVAERFCPNCGQENVETRRRFHYLFVHFFEDFIHYDSQFWTNLKSLLTPTAKLTKDYLAGKRKSQVNPVQLYIFISFIAFFLSSFNSSLIFQNDKKRPLFDAPDGMFVNDKGVNLFNLNNVNSVEQLDSIQQTLPEGKKLSIIKIEIVKKVLALKQMENPRQKIAESFIHNFPKAVFLYMPIFAFWLWLFHSKKKWLYFDHGIYTLHYFSFILLTISLYIIVSWIFSIFHKGVPWYITTAMLLYFIYYFFHSHRRMYGERKAVSRMLCTALFFINMLCIFIVITLYVIVVALLAVSV